MLTPCKESYDKPKQHIKRQRHHFANKALYSQGYGFSSSQVQMWELDHKEDWAKKNWYIRTVLGKILERPLDCTEIKLVNPKRNQPWIFTARTDGWSSNTLAIWCKAPIHWKRPRCWERLRAGREEDDRRWDGWMASLTQWTWIWANNGISWRTKEPGVLQFMGSQRMRYNLATEQQQHVKRKIIQLWREEHATKPT